MSTYKGPTEGGSGGKRGHSSMEHWVKTEEIKESSNVRRRLNDKLESRDAENFARNILFVCGRAKSRSLTAEEIFAGDPDINPQAAGISSDADVPITPDLIEWADQILVMEQQHKSKLSKNFASCLRNKRIAVLNIPDQYGFMDPKLIARLRKVIKRYI